MFVMLFRQDSIAVNRDWAPERNVRLGELMGDRLACAALGPNRKLRPYKIAICGNDNALRNSQWHALVSPIMTEKNNLQRFVDAQAHTYATALREIVRGHKTSHWMWFIFPQLLGLGSSEMARRYAIVSLEEAYAYLAHPVLGSRLRKCVAALQDLPGADANAVFGKVDAVKLRSSLTLFIRVEGGDLFEAALQRWFAGQADEKTDHLLGLRSIRST